MRKSFVYLLLYCITLVFYCRKILENLLLSNLFEFISIFKNNFVLYALKT